MLPLDLTPRDNPENGVHGTLTKPAISAITPARLARLGDGLAFFREALTDAGEFGSGKWEFALSFPELTLVNLPAIDLRWLVSHGFIEHAFEEISHRNGYRLFHPAPERAITDQSCFVLTQTGEKFAESLARQQRAGCSPNSPATKETVRPSWNAQTRELCFNGQVVKQFHRPAECQEMILSAFEKARWAVRIENPLKGRDGREASDRLHDVIRALNRNQNTRLIRFRGDGKGRGIRWSPRSLHH